MQIKIEEITAKNIINFYLPQPLTSSVAAVYLSKEQKYTADFLQNIIDIPGIEYGLLTEQMLAVKLTDASYKEDAKALVMAEIDDFISEKKALVTEKNQSADMVLIEALADSLIRPTLNRDNGDIRFVSYDGNCLEAQFTGHCAGCPYAQNTLNNIVVRTLQKYLPQIKEVKMKE